MHMRFQDKVAVITGGGTGIGFGIAKALVLEGAKVVINGRRADKLAEAAHDIDPSGEAVAVLAGDIAHLATHTGIINLATKRFGGVDILINNAGVFSPKTFLEHTEADFDHYINTILKGSFFMAQAAAKAMKQRGGGTVVQTGSMWALQAVAATPSSAYSAAKAAVHQMVKNLAIELASDNIRINAVAPAVVETPIYRTFLPENQISSVLASFDSFHPLKRIGQPKDVIGAMLFFASDEASWITGTILPVDGGVMAGRN